jgi:hypothetical protein
MLRSHAIGAADYRSALREPLNPRL